MARNGNHTKELIERTALRLFVEKGITETTIRDIAAAAGVAEGTLYRHFESKDHLAWELFSTHYLAFAQELDRLQEQFEPLQDKLAAMIRQFCTFFDRDPVLFSYLLLAQHAQLKKVTAGDGHRGDGPAKGPGPGHGPRGSAGDGGGGGRGHGPRTGAPGGGLQGL